MMGPRRIKMDTYRKRSVAWTYFKDISEASVQCVLCNGYLHKKEHGSTTPMLRHLRVKHNIVASNEGFGTEAQGTSNEQRSMEVDGDQIISVVVAVDDGDSDTTRVTPSDADANPAASDLLDASHEGASRDENDPVRHSRRRSLIWRLFEHLDKIKAARCRICMKKLHVSGGISNLRRHLMKRHPNVLSELLAGGQPHPVATLQASTLAEEAFLMAHRSQEEVVFEDGDATYMSTLNETDSPGISSLQDTMEEESQPKVTLIEGSNADGGSGEAWFPVEVTVEDVNSEVMNQSNESDLKPQIRNLEDLQGCMTQPALIVKANDEPLVRRSRRRSLIWGYFDRIESQDVAQCRVCMKKLQCFESGGTGNLHRHMAKRHPKVFAQLGSNQTPQQSLEENANGKTNENIPLSKLKPVPVVPKDSRQSEVEIRIFKRELELIEALRRTQREESRTLEHQRELLEKLQAAGLREAAAEREKIESLRKSQQEEAEDLRRQREELEKEKTEFQKKWEELQQAKEALSLLSREKENS